MPSTAFVLPSVPITSGVSSVCRHSALSRRPASRASALHPRRSALVSSVPSPGSPVPTPPSADDHTAIDASFSFALFSMATAGMAAFPLPALAEIPDGVKETFKTIPVSLVHPGMMWALFALALYAGWLGWQSRSIRSVDAEKRKELVKSKVTLRHFAIASTLLATMSVFTFEGMANTYTRTGKLFPGPHLYVGLGLVALMTTTAAMVPYMQRGDNWARNVHLAFGVTIIGMFAWQANTGMQIVGKLLKWT